MAVRMGTGLLLALISAAVIVGEFASAELEDEVDWDQLENPGWVDPTDMLNYDVSSQSMKTPPQPPSKDGPRKFTRPFGAGKASQQQQQQQQRQQDKPREESPQLNQKPVKKPTGTFKKPHGAGKLSLKGGGKNVVKATRGGEDGTAAKAAEARASGGTTPQPQAGRIRPAGGERQAAVKTPGEAADAGGSKVRRDGARLDPSEPNEPESADAGSHHADKPDMTSDDDTCACGDYAASLAALRGESEQLRAELEECAASHSQNAPPEQPYFKQYINVLLKNFRKQGLPSTSDVNYRLSCKLSPDDVTILQKYVTSKQGGIQDAHAVLVHMVTGVSAVHEEEDAAFEIPRTVQEYLAIATQICGIGVAVLVGVYFYVKLNLSWAQLFAKVLVLLFFVSIPWNWWHLYNKEIAERQAVALQDAPPECRPDQLTLWQSLKATFTLATDKCAKYHEALLVDPMWEVPPTKAVAVTLSKFFLEPLEHIGEHLGRFVKASLQDLPIHLWPIVLGFSIIISLVIIIMSFGYKLRLFYLFGLEPSRRVPESPGAVRQGIEEIREEIKKLKEAPVGSAHRPPPPSIPALSAEKVEEIVHHAVQSHLPPAPVEPELVVPVRQALAASSAPPRPPAKPSVAMVDSHTQSTPKPQKKLSTTHVASYSYAGTPAEAEAERGLAPEKTVTRDSSVVMRDSWSQTWITSGTDGKFSDMDDMTFCKMHPSWKPYQSHYVQPSYYLESGEEGAPPAVTVSSNGGAEVEYKHDDVKCSQGDLIDSGNVLSPRPASRPGSRPGSRPASRTSSTNFSVPSSTNSHVPSSVRGSQTTPLDPETLGHAYRRSFTPQKKDTSTYQTYSSSSGGLNLSMK